MNAPRRIKLSRAKGWRLPADAVKVDRSTRWGNPFNATQQYVCFPHRGLPVPLVALHEQPSLGRCIDLFTAYLRARLDQDPEFLEPLRGKHLACWCALDQPCHADVLLRLANEVARTEP
jgi:hypothetical protein